METKKLIKELSNKAEPIKTVSSPWLRAGIWIVVTVGYFAIMIFGVFNGLRFDINTKILQHGYIFEIGVTFITAILASIAAMYCSVPDNYQNTKITTLPFYTFLMLCMFLLYQLISPMDAYNTLQKVNIFQCALDMAVFSIFPVIVMFYTIYKAAATNMKRVSALATLSAVCFSYIALRLIEPNDNIKHIVFWHFIPMCATIVVGTIIGKIILKKRWVIKK